jgi:CBS-domain-containing membrane protein
MSIALVLLGCILPLTSTASAIAIGLQRLGAALVTWPKYCFLLITMKLASLVVIAMLIIYHQSTRKILTGRSSFSAKRFEKFLVICMQFTLKMKLLP